MRLRNVPVQQRLKELETLYLPNGYTLRPHQFNQRKNSLERVVENSYVRLWRHHVGNMIARES